MIEIIHVSKAYDSNPQALVDINLRVEKGKFVYMTGPSGAGKTTLLKLLAARECPSEGEIRVQGVEISRLKVRQIPYYRRTLGIVFQDLKLLARKTAFENVAFALEVVSTERREIQRKANQALRWVGLERKGSSYPSQLSSGEQQKVAIARAVVNEPYLLLADEPTGNIDSRSTEEIMQLFNEINLRGTTVILATHDETLLTMVPKDRVVLDRGRLLESTLPSSADWGTKEFSLTAS
jgi:cell division transport system ATP-binding protein